MSDAILGEIRMFAGNFAPQGWAFCDGQLLPVASNAALFSLLGTIYGGNGRDTFGLPDLRGRAPVGVGIDGNTGPGLSPIPLGQKNGYEVVNLNTSQLPIHTHQAVFNGTASAVNVRADVATTSDDTMVPPTSGATTYLSATTAKAGLSAVTFNGLFNDTAPNSDKASLGGVSGETTAAGSITVSNAGGSQAVPIRNPYLGINFIIATIGIYPSRP
ncbi:phage tail protein [Shewanella sp. OMA3-2]|uniref:phage tail protein n=1 Tax=Shewanella sp. OMA3-2 TaxID=2908650 RepID=UPI001F22185A|nr:tail fiber protein [Shewanella sp. OMA3-2]UJF22160.1 tail fiber protein [Shewanella sp. OMA3-2]